MHKAFRNLLRLIWEALCAIDHTPPCLITARAYIKMAEDATTELLVHTTHSARYKRLRSARDYSKNFCLQEADWKKVAEFMDDFWQGVYDGFFRNSVKRSGYEHYEKGYGLMKGRE
jgi:hypothetical protein